MLRLPCPIAYGLAMLMMMVAAAAAGEPADGPPDGESEEARARLLVVQLGDPDWNKREAASKELSTMGEAALPHVEAALKSEDAEVAMRASALIKGVQARAFREISERRLIKDLFFCGPFPFDRKKDKKPLEIALPPDDEIGTEATYKAGEAEVRWLRPFSPGAHGSVDFDAVFGHREYAVAYALASVQVAGEEPRKMLLLLGSDDHVQVRVNGKVVHTNANVRRMTPDQDSVEVTLDPGWNDILLKVAQLNKDWGVCLRLAEPDKSEPTGLTWDPTRGGQRRVPKPPEPEKEPAAKGAS